MSYTNPIIKGFNPDPSICRVGDDYYLVTSSFEYFPGIPIYHSTDLVNWELVGHCIDRPEQLPLETADPSGGIWAPTIRFYKGKFYVTATFSEKGNFIVSSSEPAKNYSNPVWVEMDGIDPSMLFENDTMYYCANDCGSRAELHGGDCMGISVAEMNPDTGKVNGEIKRIWEGSDEGWLEAPHIYHIGGYYYLLTAEGGSGWGHMATLARSRSVWGPYKSCPFNPILTNRNDASKQALCCGHADLISDSDGNWWTVHLGIRSVSGTKSNLGRETFLTPVEWVDGWFKAVGGMAKINPDAPETAGQKPSAGFTPDFTKAEPEKQWVFLKKPVTERYKRGNGTFTLIPSSDKLTDSGALPTFAAVRQPDFEFEANIELEFEPKEIGDEAGAAVYLTPDFMYRICKRRECDGNYICVIKIADDMKMLSYHQKTASNRVSFKITADREKYGFYCTDGANGTDMPLVSSGSVRFLTCEITDRSFTGTVVGIYAQCDKETSAEAVFDRLEIK